MSKTDLTYPAAEELTTAEHEAFKVSAMNDLRFKCWSIFTLYPTKESWDGDEFESYFKLFPEITLEDLDHFLSTYPSQKS